MLQYDKQNKWFSLTSAGKERVRFSELELNFRMSRLALTSDRIHPEVAVPVEGGVDIPLRLYGMASASNLYKERATGKISSRSVGQATLLSYGNDTNEGIFSPDQAVRLVMTDLPGVERGVFFHNRADESGRFDYEGLWFAQAVFADDPTTELVADWGMLSLWRYGDGVVGGMLSVTTDKVLGRFRGEGASGLSIISCTGGTGEVVEDYPLALFAFSDSIEETRDILFEAMHELYPNFAFRSGEQVPAPFDKLGWCSWNAYGQDVKESDIKEAVDGFKEHNVPVRFLILDDTWSHVEEINGSERIAEGITASGLVSYDPDPAKFPSGLAALVDYAKGAGIEAFGAWHALNGHWQGVMPESPMVKEHPEWFITTEGGWVIPVPESGFYEEWYKRLKEHGVDFLKIDNQGFHRRCLPYQRNMAEYMAGIQDDVRNAADKYGFPIIYCMATQPETLFNCRANQVLRVTNDFFPNNGFSTRKRLVNNFYNSFWLSKIFWPDFDMFQSRDEYAETFGRMLAISGSPIYTTDRPDSIDTTLLSRLVLPSGQIPRYDDLPGIPPNRFFENPFSSGNVLAVTATVRDTVTLGLFNANEDGQSCSGTVSLAEMGLRDGRYLVYSDSGRFEPGVLTSKDSIPFDLENMESDLITVSPIEEGFALAGNVDYLAAPAIIESVERNENGVRVSMKGSGLLLGYMESKPTGVACDGAPLSEVENDPAPGEYSCGNGLIRINAKGLAVGIQSMVDG
ncbi:MAG: Sip1-related alpha-galactosidase [Verrucomicrobiota bacterium]